MGHLCGQASLLSVSFNIMLSCYIAKMKNSMEWPDGKETGGFFSSLRVIAKKKLYNVREIICHSNSDPSRFQLNKTGWTIFAYFGMFKRGKSTHLPFLPTKVARYPCSSESWTFSVISCSWNIDCRPCTVAETSAKKRGKTEMIRLSSKLFNEDDWP